MPEARADKENRRLKRKSPTAKKLTRSLRESEERFRLLVEGVKDYAIFMLDVSGYVASWNQGAERIKGYSADEIIGEHFSKFYSAEDIERGKPEEALRIAEIEGRCEFDGWRVRKDGSKFWANVVLTALKDGTERLYGFAKITRDMTERKLIQQKLQESERLAAMGATAAVFAHEIGNPLNGISASLQVMQRQFASKENGDSPAQKMLQEILPEIQRLSALLNDFRSLARPQQIELRPTPLAQVIKELLSTEAVEYTRRGIVVEEDLPADLPMIMADAPRLKQALLNLWKNAVEAMPQGGTLTLRGRHGPGVVSLDIIDTGVGIPDDVDIFQLFKTTKDQGTGLGLAIVRQIISAHQGTIFYASQPGKGTTFTISLPI